MALPPPSDWQRAIVLYAGRNQEIVGSSEARTASGIGLSFSKVDKRLSRGRFLGEYRFEGTYMRSLGTTRRPPFLPDTTDALWLLAGVRYSLPGRVSPYVEAATGLIGFSQTTRDISLPVEFPPTVGIGVRLRGRVPVDLGVRFTHISNSQLRTPNRGLDYVFGVLSIGF